MKTYYFYDSDWFYGGTGHEKNDIKGDGFRQFLEICCRYTSTAAFTLSLEGKPQHREMLRPFEIDIPQEVAKENWPQVNNRVEFSEKRRTAWKIIPTSAVKFYHMCPELCKTMYAISDSLFSWMDGMGYCNPENPTFYRADGSVFFSSVIHEGECRLTPRDGEDVSEIISNPFWVQKERE